MASVTAREVNWKLIYCPGVLYCQQAHREGGGEQGILPWGLQTFKGPHEAFIFMIFTYIFMLFLFFFFRFRLHCHCRHLSVPSASSPVSVLSLRCRFGRSCRRMMEKSAVVEHTWEHHHPIHWEETTVLDHGRGQELLVKEASR